MNRFFYGVVLFLALFLIGCLETSQADAGENQTVNSDQNVTLDGSKSTGESLRYHWEQTNGTAVTLTNADTAKATFIAPRVNRKKMLTFKLTIQEEGKNEKSIDSINIFVKKESDKKPVITLNGESTLILTVGETYNEQGATASDDRDGDITAHITVTQDVDTSKVGTYHVTYAVKDIAGNTADVVTRTVKVIVSPLASDKTAIINFYDKDHGVEPWLVDLNNTSHMVKDVNTINASLMMPTAWNSNRSATLDGYTYFVASDGQDALALYRTDGTEERTQKIKRLIKVNPYVELNNHKYYYYIRIFNDRIFFTITSSYMNYRPHMWVSDGTAEGTKIIGKNLQAYSFEIIGDKFYFAARDLREKDGYMSKQLYMSDGTKAGTKKLTDYRGYGPGYLTVVGNELYFRFFTNDGNGKGKNLYKYVPKTKSITRFAETYVGASSTLFAFKDTLYYLGSRKLKRFDGTKFQEVINFQDIAGTELYPEFITTSKKYIYVESNGYTARHLYRCDGTTKGIEILDSYHWQYDTRVLLNEALYFHNYHDHSFMRLKEGQSEPEVIRDGINFNIPVMKKIGDKIYYIDYKEIGWNKYHHLLYVSDGTVDGTKELIEFGEGQTVEDILDFDRKPVLLMSDPAYGVELWHVDDDGDIDLIKDIANGTESAIQKTYVYKAKNNITYFLARDHFVRKYAERNTYKLYRTDGTQDGTYLLSDHVWNEGGHHFSMADKDGYVYFIASKKGEHRSHVYLWRTKGTKESTKMIMEVGSGSYAKPIYKMNNSLFFWGTDREGDSKNPYVLYKSNGTKEGTVVLTRSVSAFNNFQVIGGKLYFRGWTHELWESDGTEAGTKLIFRTDKTLYRNVHGEVIKKGDNTYFYYLSTLWKMGKDENSSTLITNDLGNVKLYIDELLYVAQKTTNTEGDRTYTISTYDVDTNETKAIKQIPGATYSVSQFRKIGNKFVFLVVPSRINDNGQLWVSDGTEEGTKMIKDSLLADKSIFTPKIHKKLLDGKVLFQGVEKDGKLKLWQTDGTEVGTQVVITAP